MERSLLITKDGSHTVAIPSLNITYHSLYGAVQESMHVFIEAGLHHRWSFDEKSPLNILEVGFGTGLNALLTCEEAAVRQRMINYTTLEPYPLSDELIRDLNYRDEHGYLKLIHESSWSELVGIHEYFQITKLKLPVANVEGRYDLVYFDAFDPVTQPEIWDAASFAKLYSVMNPGGILTTYCSRSQVRRTMAAEGFNVTKIPGPWGKREMVRAMV